MRVVFTAAADEELTAARAWHELETAGLGAQLFAEVARLVAVIDCHQLRFRVVRNTLRRALVMRFPCAIYSRVHGDTVTVEGVLHGSRDPQIWMARDP